MFTKKKMKLIFLKIKKNTKAKLFYLVITTDYFSTIFKKKLSKKKYYVAMLHLKKILEDLKAHNWMKSINESYLSKTKLGGGALCEHSHALNLVQYFVKHKNVQILNKQFKFNKDKKNYHDLSLEHN